MLYTILCYKPAGDSKTLTQEADDAVMEALGRVQKRLIDAGKLGPVARLQPAKTARTVRKPSLAVDGPFAETKEHLLGFYIIDCANLEEATEIAGELSRANPGGAHEVRPVLSFHPDTRAS
jgi:hypothetical protein